MDAGVVEDTGVPPMEDLGPPDLGPPPDMGPPPDLGCRERMRPDFPQAWPFERSAAAYADVFGAYAMVESCGNPNCHGNQNGNPTPPVFTNPPYLPGSMEDLDRNYEAAIDALWPLIQSSEPFRRGGGAVPQGPFWRHHGDYQNPPDVTDVTSLISIENAEDEGAMNAVFERGGDCSLSSWASSLPPDPDPPGCDEGGTPPDAGVEDGGGSPDAGASDTGGNSGSGELCYCAVELGPINTSFCAP